MAGSGCRCGQSERRQQVKLEIRYGTAMSEMTHVWIDGGIQVPLHRHLLVVYRRVVDRYRFASFLAEGLRQGDLCVYLAPGPMQLEMSEVLDGLGIPVDGYRQRERLFFPNPASSREQIWDYARRVFDKAEKTQAPCVRWLEEISWVRPEESTLDDTIGAVLAKQIA